MKPEKKSIPEEKPAVGRIVRPWGGFEQYALNEPCTVSLMTVKPGERLSLQSHEGRAELWIVLDDDAQVSLGDETIRCRRGDELWVPAGAKHRLSNPGNAPLRVLEVAFGHWRQEDIVRYADKYCRPDSEEAR